jgi:hypothetical protein
VSLTPEQQYLQLGSLIAEMPDLASGPITPEMNQWLGRAAVLVEATGDTFGKIALTNAAQWLGRANRDLNAQTIATVVYQALAKAKLAAPAAMQGAFLAAGHTFDAYVAVIEVLSAATTDLLMIDPYADAKILQYALSAPKQVSVRILADQDPRRYQPSLRPAVERWVQQYRSTRPLSVRLAAPNTLHDRSILVDRATAWMVGQSFKDLARKDMHLVRQQDAEATALAVAAFETMWDAATPLHEWDGPAPV